MKIVLERPGLWFSKKASKELKSLRPIFAKLSRVHERYIRAEPYSEISYWYGERPQIGLLSAAVWGSGFTALEEYFMRKRRGRRDAPGRSDLYIRTTSKTTFECEAKHRFADLGDPTEESANGVSRSLRQASKEAKQVRGAKSPEEIKHLTKADGYLGLCFVTPKIKTAKRVELHKRCLELIERLRPVNGHSDCDALVWIHGPEPIERHRWLYPGLLLAVKETGKTGTVAR